MAYQVFMFMLEVISLNISCLICMFFLKMILPSIKTHLSKFFCILMMENQIDLKNTMAYIVHQGTNPVTNEPLKGEDLIKLNITEKGWSYVDPVTEKEFLKLSEAVMIKPSSVFCQNY